MLKGENKYDSSLVGFPDDPNDSNDNERYFVVNDDTTFEKTWLSYHRIASSTNICNASRLSDDQIVIGETAKIDLKAFLNGVE